MAGKKKVHKKTTITEVTEHPKKSSKKKKTTKRKSTKRKSSSKKSASHERMENALIENFISLQKVMVTMSSKFDELTDKMTKLLDLFEISAKTLTQNDLAGSGIQRRDDKELMGKMNDIIDQNRTIARGLTLMHDRITEDDVVPEPAPMRNPIQNQNPPTQNPMPQKSLPPLPRLPSMQPKSNNSGELTRQIRGSSAGDTYQKSIYANEHKRKSST